MTRILYLCSSAFICTYKACLCLLGLCPHPRAKQILRRRDDRLGEECLACGRWVGFQLDSERRFHLSALADGPGRIERQAYQALNRRLTLSVEDPERSRGEAEGRPEEFPLPVASLHAARASRRTQ